MDKSGGNTQKRQFGKGCFINGSVRRRRHAPKAQTWQEGPHDKRCPSAGMATTFKPEA
jgi:hypothetical protein